MELRRKAAAAVALATFAVAAGVVLNPSPAYAHGAIMKPGSRTYLCWLDSMTATGEAIPVNPACQAAVAQSGATAIYNWFAVLRSDGAGRTVGFIPDGKLCSGAATVYDFSGFDLARTDWPVTHLTAGANFAWEYSNWAHHPGTFRMFVTKNSWSLTRPLAWNDLEAEPFLSVTNPPQSGAVGTTTGHYYWSGNLPANKSGRHIIYTTWTRSDSTETFYNCSDVVFDGGNGNVTGIREPGPTPTPSPTTPTPGPTTASPAPSAQCVATYQVMSSWPDGFQAQISLLNTGTSPIANWTAHWTFNGTQAITNIWNATHSQVSAHVTASPMPYNRTIPPGSSITFGFLGSGPPASTAMGPMCVTS